MLDVPANSILQKEAEGDMRGRVYGVLGAFVGGVGILPVMIGGVLADFVGVGKVIFLLGGAGRGAHTSPNSAHFICQSVSTNLHY